MRKTNFLCSMFLASTLASASLNPGKTQEMNVAERARQIATLNNQGTKALQEGKIDFAISKYLQALRLDPKYPFARENLSIAYNNLALGEKDSQKALEYLHKAVLLQPENPTTRKNLRATILKLKKNPDAFADRVALGDAFLAQKNYIGATVEYQEALRLKDDPAVREKLAAIPAEDELLAVSKVEQRTYTKQNKLSGSEVDFEPYMAALQRQVKKHWFPPKGNESKRVVVVFKIDRDGLLSGLKLEKSSGVPIADKAAMDAVVTAAPFAPLPKQAPNVVDIIFTLDYNVFGGSRKTTKISDVEASESKKIAERAQALFKAGNTSESINLLRQSLKVNPYNTAAAIVLSDQLLAQAAKAKSNEDALDLICEACRTDDTGNKSESRFTTTIKALGKDPKSAEDLSTLSDQAKERHQYETAIYLLRRALPLNLDVEAVRGIKKKLAKAYAEQSGSLLIEKWELALEKRKSADSYAGLGSAYEMSGDYEKAMSCYEEAIKSDPYNSVASSLMKSLKARMEKPEGDTKEAGHDWVDRPQK